MDRWRFTRFAAPTLRVGAVPLSRRGLLDAVDSAKDPPFDFPRPLFRGYGIGLRGRWMGVSCFARNIDLGSWAGVVELGGRDRLIWRQVIIITCLVV